MPFDAEFALKGLLYITGILGSALFGVVLWAARAVMGKVDGLERVVRREFRAFDRRLTRVETVLRVHPPAEDLPSDQADE